MKSCWRVTKDFTSRPENCREYDAVCYYLDTGKMCPGGRVISL